MASTLETYLNKIKTERYAKDMRNDIIEAIRQASRMGQSSGGSGGSSGNINYDELGSEMGYIPYIYANMYDGVLYDIDDFKSGDLGSPAVYRKLGNLPLYIPDGTKFRVKVDITDGLQYGEDGQVKLNLSCFTKTNKSGYRYVFEINPKTTPNFISGWLTSFGDMESIFIKEVINSTQVSAEHHFGYKIKIELLSPSRTNSRLRYILGDKFLDQSIQTDHDVSPDDPSNKSFIFKPIYNLVSGYKYYFKVAVTPSSGYTVENTEIARLYLYKAGEDYTSGQYITIKDTASQTLDLTSSGEWSEVRLEYLTMPSGIYEYDPLIKIEGFPYSNGESPSPSDYDIGEHGEEIEAMDFIKFIQSDGSSYPNNNHLNLMVLPGSSSIYGEIYDTYDRGTHYGVYHRSIITGGNIEKIEFYEDLITGDKFVRTWKSGVQSDWTKLSIPYGAINWEQLHPDIDKTINEKIGPYGVIGAITDVDDLNVWYYSQPNQVYYLYLTAQASSYFGVPNGTLAEVKMDYAGSISEQGVDTRQRYMTFPEYSGVKWVQSVTEVGDQHSRIFSAGVWRKSENYTFGKKPMYSFSMDANGSITGYNNITSMGTGSLAGSHKVYVAEKVTTISSGFATTSPNLTDIYVDNYAENINIDSSITSSASITIHYRNDFNVLDLVIPNLIALNQNGSNS